MQPLTKGRYTARLADGPGDITRALALRSQIFRKTPVGDQSGDQDGDLYDTACEHVLISDIASGQLVCCYRLMMLADGAALDASYSAQFYDLARLQAYGGPMLELGRFCVHPLWRDGDILRLAWAALARMVDETGARLLFGCASFDGARVDDHTAALALLRAAHLAPDIWRPQPRARQTYHFASALAAHPADLRAGLAGMPSLLRTYLGMGGWVSDHAVIDRDLDTLHVFTAVEIADIPAARARALRAIAG